MLLLFTSDPAPITLSELITWVTCCAGAQISVCTFLCVCDYTRIGRQGNPVHASRRATERTNTKEESISRKVNTLLKNIGMFRGQSVYLPGYGMPKPRNTSSVKALLLNRLHIMKSTTTITQGLEGRKTQFMLHGGSR